VTHAQFVQTVQQQERELAEEVEARRIETANEILFEMSERDKEFREELESKYPILKGWQ
jgi:hypothetical protein